MSILAQSASAEIEPTMLLSVVKPILAFIPFVLYVWITGSRLDKDARYFQIDPARWAVIFAVAPMLALLTLAIPIFWVGWPLSILIMAGTVVTYVMVRNPRVPEAQRWGVGALKIGESMQARRAASARKAANLRFLDGSKRERPVPLKDDPLHGVHLAVEGLLDPCIEGRATRLDLAPTQQGFIPSQLVDGVRMRRDPMPPDLATASIDYLKGVAGLDANERRKRQSADFIIVAGDAMIRASMSVSGGTAGQTMRIDFDREKQLSKPLDTVGFLDSQMKAMAPLLATTDRHGVMLVATAPGQGLTTLLYSLVSRHDAFTCSVKSLEKHIELRVDGVDQQLWNPSNPAVDYANQLQSIIRRGPDITLVADLMEPRVGQVMAGPASDMLFYVGVSVNVPAGHEFAAAIKEWFRSCGDLDAGSKALRGVVTQRTIRKLCEYCRQPHPRAEEIAKRIGVPAGTTPTLFAASGKVQVKNRVEPCPVCKGSGFLGQIGVQEVVMFDDESRALFAANDAGGAYATARRKTKLPSLQEAGLVRVRDGTTSIEEFQRIFAPPKAPPSAAAPSAPPAGAAASAHLI